MRTHVCVVHLQALALFCGLAGVPPALIPTSVARLGVQTFKSVLRGHHGGKKARKKARARAQCEPSFSGHHLM